MKSRTNLTPLIPLSDTERGPGGEVRSAGYRVIHIAFGITTLYHEGHDGNEGESYAGFTSLIAESPCSSWRKCRQHGLSCKPVKSSQGAAVHI